MVETLFNGFAEYIQDHYAGELYDIDTRLKDPEWVVGYVDDLLSGTKYPRAAIEHDGAQLEQSANGLSMVRLYVRVLIAVTARDSARLHEIALRYVDAFYKMFRTDQSLGGLCETSELTESTRVSTVDRDRAVIDVTVRLDREVVN